MTSAKGALAVSLDALFPVLAPRVEDEVTLVREESSMDYAASFVIG
jgi:hypothetical protein